MPIAERPIAAKAVTFVATKVTKKAFSRNASLPHIAFALQTWQNHGLLNFAATAFTHYPALQANC
ncbi:hypothetical protein [Mucilaginibacter pocheonensis]|uniref:Uncharacterized protein n=1 Tax=Mucilaginibacter pocheonensis TaxID=398050 RepID=A0ABU1TGJ7_9SPHI|nr:hypothetical protein [Mucilaginibacter pocheonensis]MDR6944518.1 hypothetical protein [Mucilaginibacter pocheonensis]